MGYAVSLTIEQKMKVYYIIGIFSSLYPPTPFIAESSLVYFK